MTERLQFLFPAITRSLRRSFDERARRLGVTRTQWRVLMSLARHEGCNQGALAEMLEVEPITLCRMVDRLQDAGLVERRPDPQDRRARLLYLQPNAGPILADLEKIGAELLEDAVEGIGDQDLGKLADMLERIRTNLSQRDTDRAING